MIPTIGRIVWYSVSAQDVGVINQRRVEASKYLLEQRAGIPVHTGNTVGVGDVFPMVITRVWGDQPHSAVNGQVILDGTDTLWITSAQVGEGPRTWAWPARSSVLS